MDVVNKTWWIGCWVCVLQCWVNSFSWTCVHCLQSLSSLLRMKKTYMYSQRKRVHVVHDDNGPVGNNHKTGTMSAGNDAVPAHSSTLVLVVKENDSVFRVIFCWTLASIVQILSKQRMSLYLINGLLSGRGRLSEEFAGEWACSTTYVLLSEHKALGSGVPALNTNESKGTFFRVVVLQAAVWLSQLWSHLRLVHMKRIPKKWRSNKKHLTLWRILLALSQAMSPESSAKVKTILHHHRS